MKKQLKTTKKLTVNTETVRKLTDTQLDSVVGGVYTVLSLTGGKCLTTNA